MINPSVLRKLRAKKNWTQADLQQHSKVDKQTISMIERGQRTRVRKHTVMAICKAFGIEPAVLEGDAPVSHLEWEHRSALTVRVDDGPRNALALVSIRYGVPVHSIVELAPFLFAWAAEMSLKRRAERLTELEKIEAELEAMEEHFPHLDARLTRSISRYDVMAAERRSIEARDIFAYNMEGSEVVPGLSEDFEEFEGPIVKFLQDLAAQIDSTAEFESWHPSGGPDYAICKDEAAAVVGGDADLANEIIAGNVGLHKMPADLRKKERMADRVAWARREAELAAEQLNAMVGPLPVDLDSLQPDAAS